jgi:excisionase family DNA binding protein
METRLLQQTQATALERPRRTDGGRWVTLRRAREILGVDESTLRRWADSGRLQVYRTPGGHRRFALDNLQEMVSGETPHRGADEVERVASARIRRQIQRARQQGDAWYAGLSDADREELRDLGHRLLEMAGEYLGKRTHRATLLDEAREVGGAYGRILIDSGLPLASAVGAYVGFRRTMDETTRQTSIRESLPVERALEATSQVHILGDQVLLGIAAAYEAADSAVTGRV